MVKVGNTCFFEPIILFILGRKVVTNLDSILKSRDSTLSTKVCLVKAMVFPVVMYGCEIWTVKKAECRRIDAFAPLPLRQTQRSPEGPRHLHRIPRLSEAPWEVP